MKQYNTNQKKKIVEIISKTKNKKAQALKFNISIRTYYYWKKKLEETDSIENKSRKPKNSPNKVRNKKIINKVIEIRKKYKYGKTKIKKLLEKENIKKRSLHAVCLWQRKGSNRHYALRTSSYAFFGEIRYYQFTAVDIATKMSFRYLYSEKTPATEGSTFR